MTYFWEDVCMPLLLIGGVLALFGLIAVAGVAAIDYADCRGFKNGTGIETRWSWGCYAKVDGQWIPKEYAFGKVNEIRLKETKK